MSTKPKFDFIKNSLITSDYWEIILLLDSFTNKQEN